jgi:REP element-mobilizing transposase RayT
MPSTHLSSNIHLVFSTKERRPMIIDVWRARLHAYLGGIVKGMDAIPLAIGGFRDHEHLLVSLRSKHRLDYFVRDLKADSSAWVHKEFDRLFEWQKGYGGFSVCPSEREFVRRYIENQEQHHRKETFEQEYIRLLGENEVEYNETYLW